MELVEMVKKAAAIPFVTSSDIRIDFGWFPNTQQRGETQAAIKRALDADKAEFVKGVLRTINATHDSDAVKSDPAKKELAELFGEEVLTHPAITNSEYRFLFSLTRKGSQFRCWYAPFGSVSYDHFDSCGHGIVFHVSCDNDLALRQWARSVVGDLTEWVSDYGSVWIGRGRPGHTFSSNWI